MIIDLGAMRMLCSKTPVTCRFQSTSVVPWLGRAPLEACCSFSKANSVSKLRIFACATVSMDASEVLAEAGREA
eukprot:7193431-Pyramimonas_sp.AAC.1